MYSMARENRYTAQTSAQAVGRTGEGPLAQISRKEVEQAEDPAAIDLTCCGLPRVSQVGTLLANRLIETDYWQKCPRVPSYICPPERYRIIRVELWPKRRLACLLSLLSSWELSESLLFTSLLISFLPPIFHAANPHHDRNYGGVIKFTPDSQTRLLTAAGHAQTPSSIQPRQPRPFLSR